MEVWTKRAFLIACNNLPKDERKFYLRQIANSINQGDIMTNIIVEWLKKNNA